MKSLLVAPSLLHLPALLRDAQAEARRVAWERAGGVIAGSCALRERFDEVGLMELVLALEEAFDVDIDPDEVEEAVTLDDLLQLLAVRVGKRHGAWSGYASLDASDRDSAPPSVR
jgi:hypothetical protein